MCICDLCICLPEYQCRLGDLYTFPWTPVPRRVVHVDPLTSFDQPWKKWPVTGDLTSGGVTRGKYLRERTQTQNVKGFWKGSVTLEGISKHWSVGASRTEKDCLCNVLVVWKKVWSLWSFWKYYLLILFAFWSSVFLLRHKLAVVCPGWSESGSSTFFLQHEQIPKVFQTSSTDSGLCSASVGTLKSLYAYLIGKHINSTFCGYVTCGCSPLGVWAWSVLWFVHSKCTPLESRVVWPSSIDAAAFNNGLHSEDFDKDNQRITLPYARVNRWTFVYNLHAPVATTRTVVWGWCHIWVQCVALRCVSVSGCDVSLTKQLPGWSCQ